MNGRKFGPELRPPNAQDLISFSLLRKRTKRNREKSVRMVARQKELLN